MSRTIFVGAAFAVFAVTMSGAQARTGEASAASPGRAAALSHVRLAVNDAIPGAPVRRAGKKNSNPIPGITNSRSGIMRQTSPSASRGAAAAGTGRSQHKPFVIQK